MNDSMNVKRFNLLEWTEKIDKIYEKYKNIHQGQADQNIWSHEPTINDSFGISLMTIDGQSYHVGDTQVAFSIQSIAKPFVYGLALEDWGEEKVLEVIGVEPTGEPFNSIVEPEEIFQRQYNPLINAGAIATTSLIKGKNLTEKREHLWRMFEDYIGHRVGLEIDAFKSRQHQDNLNRAIAYMMLNFHKIEGNINHILDLYFHQCSVSVTCQDLVGMATTLANQGINPITKTRAIKGKYIKNILSIMYSCGLYDYSGQWAYNVGIAAKSGLSGAIIGVIPNQMGIAVFSPPLGTHRKSWKGVKVFEALSNELSLHLFQKPCGYFQGFVPQQKSVNIQDNSTNHQVNQVGNAEESMIASVLEELREKYLPLSEGKVYQSEPDLYWVNPNWFAISLVSVTGETYSVGDWQILFLLQSISKVFTYGLALEDWGREYVLTKVDVEPTGDPYNSIIKLENRSKRPYNPMVNAGAIATTSLIKGHSPAHRLQRILQMYEKYIGHQVFVDTSTFVSEQNTGDRNLAIAYLLRNFNIMSGDIRPNLDLYLQQCSVLVNCQDLAMMGATLANNGVNPLTGKKAINPEYVKDILSVMQTCGMYDFAGEWIYKVGFPAKSGVGGGIIAVVPQKMGIAVFSPPLDQHGNSIRGIKVCEALSRYFNWHIFKPTMF
jgi:glutaminase